MSARSILFGFVATILAAAPMATASAQGVLPLAPADYRHDFAPFETFDIKNMSAAPDPHEGFFFTFDKLSWAFSGEKNLIGNPNVVANFPDILRGVTPPQVFNGLNDSSPEATFAWGERYEFGYVADHHGWTASVLDGPEVSDIEMYGDVEAILDDPRNTNVIVTTFNPTSGNVVILFDAPANMLLGFLPVDADLDGTIDGFADLDGDGVLDLDDLIVHLTSFDEVTVRNRTELDGIDLMKTYRFKPSSHGSFVEFSFGARYLRFHDNFRVDAFGGILNDLQLGGIDPANPVEQKTSFWDTTIENHIVGPQVAMKWTKRIGRFSYNANGRFTFGYNVQDHDQVGQIGTGLDTDLVGQPILMSNTAFRHGKQEQDFSPLVELRTELNYHLTTDFALKLGFNATFIDNIRRASRQVDYTLPNMGFIDGGTQEIFVAGVNFGCEFNR